MKLSNCTLLLAYICWNYRILSNNYRILSNSTLLLTCFYIFRIMIKENHCVTSISARTWVSREARDPSLLISCACNSLLLYRILNSDGDLQKKTSFNIQHSEYGIRSSFCPLTSFRQGACVVSGSEDKSVYFFNIDEPNLPLNTLLGHSSPVIDVCWNYDESLLASCDVEGSVIIWKRVQ